MIGCFFLKSVRKADGLGEKSQTKLYLSLPETKQREIVLKKEENYPGFYKWSLKYLDKTLKRTEMSISSAESLTHFSILHTPFPSSHPHKFILG